MEGTVRIVGLDIHRVAEVVSLLDGEIVKFGWFGCCATS